jgi:hypothetical protein
MTAADAAANPDIVAEALAQDPKSYLYVGFTTVLDLVGSGDRIARWNALELRPDAHFCAAAVSVNHQLRHVRFPGFSYAESGTAFAAALASTAQETPEAVIGRIADDGAICVKTMYDSFARIAPNVEELEALVAAAHARDLPVFVHANRREARPWPSPRASTSWRTACGATRMKRRNWTRRCGEFSRASSATGWATSRRRRSSWVSSIRSTRST